MRYLKLQDDVYKHDRNKNGTAHENVVNAYFASWNKSCAEIVSFIV